MCQPICRNKNIHECQSSYTYLKKKKSNLDLVGHEVGTVVIEPEEIHGSANIRNMFILIFTLVINPNSQSVSPNQQFPLLRSEFGQFFAQQVAKGGRVAPKVWTRTIYVREHVPNKAYMMIDRNLYSC